MAVSYLERIYNETDMYDLTSDDEKTIVRIGGQWSGCVAVQENWESTSEELEALFDAPILGVTS